MSKIRTNERKFPRGLEERVERVYPAINGESKSLTLMHLDRKHFLTAADIYHGIEGTLRGKGYLPDERTISGYCSGSLFLAGLVSVRELVSDEGEVSKRGYRLTDAGVKYGLPISAFALDYAARECVSLYRFLGSTKSFKEPSSESNGVRILEMLMKEGEVNETKISHALNIGMDTVVSQLRKLKNAGLVDFSSVGIPKSHFPSNWNYHTKARISIRNMGKDFVEGFHNPLRDALSDGKVLKTMADSYSHIIGNESDFTSLAVSTTLLHSRESHSINKKHIEQRMREIYSLFKRNGKGMNVSELADALKLDRSGARRYLTRMQNAGMVTSRESSGGLRVYSLRRGR